MSGQDQRYVITPEGLRYPVAPSSLRISPQQRTEIIRAAQLGLPNEACGLIAGIVEDGIAWVRHVYVLPNVDASPEHFTLAPKDQLAVLRDARAQGLELIGNWHSHPATPSRPSAEDIRLAHDPEAHYLILSLAGTEPVLRSFRVQNRVVSLETITIEED